MKKMAAHNEDFYTSPHDRQRSVEEINDSLMPHNIPCYVSQPHSDSSSKPTKNRVEEFLSFLIEGQKYPSFFILRHIRVLFFKASRAFLDDFALSLQNRLDHIFAHLSKKSPQQASEEADLKISALLSYLAFAKMKTGDKVTVPYFDPTTSSWTKRQYAVERINLTGSFLGSPYFAYGLIPQDSSGKAPAHILFMGTTYPRL